MQKVMLKDTGGCHAREKRKNNRYLVSAKKRPNYQSGGSNEKSNSFGVQFGQAGKEKK